MIPAFLGLVLACTPESPKAAGPGARVSLEVSNPGLLPEDPVLNVRDADDPSLAVELRSGGSARIPLTPGRHALYALVRWSDARLAEERGYVTSSCEGSVDVVVPEEGFVDVAIPVTCAHLFEEVPSAFGLVDGERASCNWADAWGLLPDGRAWELHLALPRADFEAREDIAYDLPLDGTTARMRVWDDSSAEDTLTFSPCGDVETTWTGRALDLTGNVRLAARSNGLDEDCDTWTYAGAFAFEGLATAEGPVTVPSFEGRLGFFGGCYGR